MVLATMPLCLKITFEGGSSQEHRGINDVWYTRPVTWYSLTVQYVLNDRYIQPASSNIAPVINDPTSKNAFNIFRMDFSSSIIKIFFCNYIASDTKYIIEKWSSGGEHRILRITQKESIATSVSKCLLPALIHPTNHCSESITNIWYPAIPARYHIPLDFRSYLCAIS